MIIIIIIKKKYNDSGYNNNIKRNSERRLKSGCHFRYNYTQREVARYH